jgi:hypothetical protein
MRYIRIRLEEAMRGTEARYKRPQSSYNMAGGTRTAEGVIEPYVLLVNNVEYVSVLQLSRRARLCEFLLTRGTQAPTNVTSRALVSLVE